MTVVGTITLRGPFYEVTCVPLVGGGWRVVNLDGQVTEHPAAGDPYLARDLHLEARRDA